MILRDPPLNRYIKLIPLELFRNYLQFSLIILIIVATLLIISPFRVFNKKFVRIKQCEFANASRKNYYFDKTGYVVY